MNKGNKLLKFYALSITAFLVYTFLAGFDSAEENQKFDEITVQRINVVESDGSLKMVISNKEKQHPGMMDGKSYGERERAPGIVFFNEEQDEVGALMYYGNKDDGANLYLSVDQYKNDQIMQMMQYTDREKNSKYGMMFWERDKDISLPLILSKMDSLENEGYNYRQKLEKIREDNGGKPVQAPRMFVGKEYDRSAGIFIRDQNGIERLKVYVDTLNTPRIEVLDDKGKVVKELLQSDF